MRAAIEETGGSRRQAHPGRRRLLIALGPALLVAVVGGYLWSSGYVARNPEFCASCHVAQDQYVLWTRSEHHNVICQDCHKQTTQEALGTLMRFSLGVTKDDDGGPLHNPRVPPSACVACHEQSHDDWPHIDASVGHKVHFAAGVGDCMKCHGRSIHKFRPTLDSCGECHPDQVVRASRMEQVHCLACHDFLSAEGTLRPTRKVCLDCHRSQGLADPGGADNTAMANLPCQACHRPHQPSGGSMSQACRACHDQMEVHGLHRLEAHGECSDCHARHEWSVSPAACQACHDKPTDHGDGRVCWACHQMKR